MLLSPQNLLLEVKKWKIDRSIWRIIQGYIHNGPRKIIHNLVNMETEATNLPNIKGPRLAGRVWVRSTYSLIIDPYILYSMHLYPQKLFREDSLLSRQGPNLKKKLLENDKFKKQKESSMRNASSILYSLMCWLSLYAIKVSNAKGKWPTAIGCPHNNVCVRRQFSFILLYFLIIMQFLNQTAWQHQRKQDTTNNPNSVSFRFHWKIHSPCNTSEFCKSFCTDIDLMCLGNF